MKSQKTLESFTAYCKAHPDERFWQALRNWSKWNFIYGSEFMADTFKDTLTPDSGTRRTGKRARLHDTFYDD